MFSLMNVKLRRNEILKLINNDKTVLVNDLAKRFLVSKITIRRDLKYLEAQGLIKIHYGGASVLSGNSKETSYDIKKGLEQAYKNKIAKEACKIVQNGNVIILDCGTTTSEMVEYLNEKDITIITNNYMVPKLIRNFDRVKLILLGGEYDRKSNGVVSSKTILDVENYHADFAFISTQGISEYGLTVPTQTDCDVKKSLCKSAKRTILILDSSKFDHDFSCKFLNINELDMIITDERITDYNKEMIKTQKIPLIIVHK